MAVAVAGLVTGIVLAAVILGIAWIALFVWSLVHILKARKDSTWKILWIVVMALIPLLGTILYYFIGRDQAKRK